MTNDMAQANPPPGQPRLVIDQTGSGDFRTIGEAIRASVVPGTLLVVNPGIYREALVLDRDVEIVGEGDRARIVVETTDTDAVTVTADRAVVRNLTVRAVGSGDASGAVWVQRGRVVVVGCDLTSAIGSVVYITGKDSAPVFHDCEIRDESDRGVLLSDQGQGTIEQCVISGNALAGMVIETGGNPTVRDCQIRDNKEAGVYVYEQGQGTFTGNTLTGIPSGAWVIRADAGRVTRTGNTPNA